MEIRQPTSGEGNSPFEAFNLGDRAVLCFSWLLVMVAGLMPIVDASLKRSPSISKLVTIAFFVAVASGIALRRQYSWVGLVLHVFSQIVIWLSVFCISLALALVAAG
jgi:hypothetical protein